MKVFFDQNVPKGLAKLLTGHEVTRAKELDWHELKNGDLLKAAEDYGFDVMVSCDRNLAYQQRVDARRIGIVALSTNNWPLMKERVAEIAKAVDASARGSYRSVDCGRFVGRKARRVERGPGI